MLFMDHILTSEEEKMDLQKTQAIQELPTPQRRLEHFLGIASLLSDDRQGLHLHNPLCAIPKEGDAIHLDTETFR